jgi:hypothetical protein
LDLSAAVGLFDLAGDPQLTVVLAAVAGRDVAGGPDQLAVTVQRTAVGVGAGLDRRLDRVGWRPSGQV